jgi:Ca2+-binding RTX toxin-like protein
LDGSSGNDTLVGQGGIDRSILYGDDIFFGGSGNDRIQLGEGDETIRGGSGTDWISFFHANYTVGVRVNLRTGMARGHGTDRLAGIENVFGTSVDDILIGDSRANVLAGSHRGEDTLVGGGGNDSLRAREFAPRDALDGGLGTDRCKADRRDIVTRCEV